LDFHTEPTPTFEEFLLSHSPANLMRYDDMEDVLYKTADFVLLLAPIYSKAIYLWAWQGVPMFAERGALYLASQESWGLYRLMTKPSRLLRLATNPVVAVPVLSAVGAVAATSAYDEAVVQKAPEHERSGWWEFWSTMLTGTGPAASYTDI